MGIGETARTAYREALPALSASVVGGLLAGVVLGGMRAEFRAVPGLLVLVPALLATRGNVYGSFGARLSTGLHQGLVEPRVSAGDERLRGAVAAALSNGIGIAAFAALAAYLVLTLLGEPVAPAGTLVLVATLAGVLSGVALAGVVILVVFAGYRRGLDPDTLVGPLVTTTGDVFGTLFLLLSVRATLALVGGGG
ncbi:magnesium transporter [Halorarum halophilum]|uniref:Magnesium transporter n=1 Tax=Halorarum halophilum TaxID=2743090 RepID=A0A7D5KXG5_9EURY|nr:magnesium transporter [Halobaculum halophilum]QLG28198.1 magnesium transporter [Halobaculum halophilum]